MTIGVGDVYKVVEAMAPLYVALFLGYGSVKWWSIFNPQQCDSVNKFVCYFTLPLFTFSFVAHANPYEWNYSFIWADAISKVIIVVVLAIWSKCSSKGSYSWFITNFSLSTLTNALVVGVPLAKAMYGPKAVDLVVQASIVQAIIWLTLLLFVLEIRKTRSDSTCVPVNKNDSPMVTFESIKDIQGNENMDVVNFPETTKDTEENDTVITITSEADKNNNETETTPTIPRTSLISLMKIVLLKMAHNPNAYASVIGLIWALISNRWDFCMPSIMEGSISIMSNAGTGTAMFSMGLFMATQKKLIACGPTLTVIGMVLRFVFGPAAMAIGCIAVGLQGDTLRVAIIQSAIPQSITAFIYAKEYGLHADVLSTAVIFGMMVSLPLLIGYYFLLAYLN